ncbi:MAG: hypothetical protein K8R36_08455 [Planctomycetales bacterium]|nr:hypothetical protein [Planctomycetales bacterium]
MAHLRQPLRSRYARWLPLAAGGYPLVVLGLAAFLIGLLCSQTASPEYHAEAVLRRDAGQLDGECAELTAWLKSDAVLRAALINTKWPELTEGTAVADQNRAVAQLRERLTIATLSQPDESPRLLISCTAPRGWVAMNLACELATQVADHFESQQREIAHKQTEEKLTQIDERLRTIREAEERQRGELERLRHSQLAMVVANPRSQGGSGSPSENLNPRWVELKKQLDALQYQRTEMLEVLQENHPEINGLNLRIAKVTGSLNKTPRQLSSPISPISHKASSASHRQPLLEWRRPANPIAQQQYQQDAAPITREGLDPFLNMAAQIDEAAHQLAVLTSQRKGMEWDKTEIEQSQAALATVPPPAWRTELVHRVSKTGGGYTQTQLRWAGVFSLGITGLVMLSQGRIVGRRRLASLTDVLVHVRLPLTGIVELTNPHKDSALQVYGTTPLRLLTRCGEAFLLGILLTCLASAWFDPSLASEYLTSPLGALAETARRIL